jgi:hypothetical protein
VLSLHLQGEAHQVMIASCMSFGVNKTSHRDPTLSFKPLAHDHKHHPSIVRLSPHPIGKKERKKERKKETSLAFGSTIPRALRVLHRRNRHIQSDIQYQNQKPHYYIIT